MNIRYFSVLPIIFIASAMCESSSYDITLDEAIIAASENDKEWASDKADEKSSQERYSMHKTMFLPSLEGFININRQKKDGKDTAYENGDTSVDSTNQLGVRLRQNIFNGGSTFNNMKASRHESRAAVQKLKLKESQLVQKVIEAYVNVWFGLKRVEALKKKEENLHKTLVSQEASRDVGVSTTSEVAQANANYQRAKFERINAETELFAYESEFEKLTGMKAPKISELPNIDFGLPGSQDELLALALKNNSSIIAAKEQEQSALKTLDAHKGKLLPSCDVEVSAARNRNKEGYPDGRDARLRSGSNYSVGLTVTVPIFSNDQYNGNTYSQIELNHQAALKARFAAENAILEVRKECVINWNTYISANAMIQASRSAVTSAELSSASNIEETAMGMKSNTDVWVKENNLLDSRTDLANSQRQKFIAAVKILALAGQLSIKSMLIKIRNAKKNDVTVVGISQKS